MTTWQHSEPFNLTVQTHHNHSLDEDSPSDLPGLLVEETLEFQGEYPQVEVEEGVEGVTLECPQQHQQD